MSKAMPAWAKKPVELWFGLALAVITLVIGCGIGSAMSSDDKPEPNAQPAATTAEAPPASLADTRAACLAKLKELAGDPDPQTWPDALTTPPAECTNVGTQQDYLDITQEALHQYAEENGLISYRSCDEVRAAGKAPLHRGDPGYRSGLDRDGDGVACD